MTHKEYNEWRAITADLLARGQPDRLPSCIEDKEIGRVIDRIHDILQFWDSGDEKIERLEEIVIDAVGLSRLLRQQRPRWSAVLPGMSALQVGRAPFATFDAATMCDRPYIADRQGSPSDLIVRFFLSPTLYKQGNNGGDHFDLGDQRLGPKAEVRVELRPPRPVQKHPDAMPPLNDPGRAEPTTSLPREARPCSQPPNTAETRPTFDGIPDDEKAAINRKAIPVADAHGLSNSRPEPGTADCGSPPVQTETVTGAVPHCLGKASQSDPSRRITRSSTTVAASVIHASPLPAGFGPSTGAALAPQLKRKEGVETLKDSTVPPPVPPKRKAVANAMSKGAPSGGSNAHQDCNPNPSPVQAGRKSSDSPAKHQEPRNRVFEPQGHPGQHDGHGIPPKSGRRGAERSGQERLSQEDYLTPSNGAPPQAGSVSPPPSAVGQRAREGPHDLPIPGSRPSDQQADLGLNDISIDRPALDGVLTAPTLSMATHVGSHGGTDEQITATGVADPPASSPTKKKRDPALAGASSPQSAAHPESQKAEDLVSGAVDGVVGEGGSAVSDRREDNPTPTKERSPDASTAGIAGGSIPGIMELGDAGATKASVAAGEAEGHSRNTTSTPPPNPGLVRTESVHDGDASAKPHDVGPLSTAGTGHASITGGGAGCD